MLKVTSVKVLSQGYGPQKPWWEKAYDAASSYKNDIKNVARGGSLTGTLMNRHKQKKWDQYNQQQRKSGEPISGVCLKCGKNTIDGVIDVQNVSKSTAPVGGEPIILCRQCANTYRIAPGTAPAPGIPGTAPVPGAPGTTPAPGEPIAGIT